MHRRCTCQPHSPRKRPKYSRQYALARRAFGRPIAHHQALAFLIADMASAVEMARALAWEAAWRLDAGHDAREPCASAFLEASEQAMFVTPNGVQILGGHGFMQDYPVEKLMREAGARPRARRDRRRARGRRPRAGRPPAARRSQHRGRLMQLAIDAATAKRLAGIRGLGRSQLRPLGLEADRAGRPTPPEHPFFALLVKAGQGATRWVADAEADAAGDSPDRVGSSRTLLCLAEELSYWDRGVAVSFPGPGLGEPPLLSMDRRAEAALLGPFVEPDRALGILRHDGPGASVAGIARAPAATEAVDLDGDKSFAANASRADWIVVWATIDASLGREGHRAFVVERGTPGLGDFVIERKMGLKAYESTSFTLRDCRVPAANLIGGDEHYARRAGFKGALRSFNATRPLVAAMAVGIGRAALDEALAFAREHDLAGDPRVRDRLERIRRKLRAARLLCWRAAWLADHRRPNMLEASMAKAVAPAVALEATTLGMELLGEVGGRGDHLIEKLFRDVKAMDIVEGTGQIQRIVMARDLVQLPRD
jgi:acyl-CoA dehydrogenase